MIPEKNKTMHTEANYFSTTTGAIAFIVTTANIVSGFPLLARMSTGAGDNKSLIIVFFCSGLCMQLLWLIYLWHLNDLFLRIGLSLQAASSSALTLLSIRAAIIKTKL
jgi:hypothetical protein